MSAPATPPAPAPENDDDTVYRPELTGRDIDELCALLDALVRAGGLPAAVAAAPLVEKITAPRRAAKAGQ